MKWFTAFVLCLFAFPLISAAQSVPQVFTGSAIVVESQSAVITGDVNPMGSSASAWFEYGPSTGLGSRTQTEFVGSGSTQVRIAATLQNLQPNTTYYYRTVAQGSNFGIQYGSMQSFVTKSGSANPSNPSNLPTVTVSAPTDLRNTSVTLHGKILPNGSDTTAWFEYGTTSAVANRSESRIAAGNQAGLELNFHLGALRAGTTYYYRLAAQNTQGVARTELRTFTTTGTYNPNPAPTPAPAPAPTPTSSVPTSTVPNPAFNSVLTLIARSDANEPAIGSEFNYTLEYRNDGSTAASSTVLRVTLPQETEFVLADLVPNIEGQNLTFTIGAVPANTQKSVRIRLRVKENSAPVQVSIPALMTYRTPKNEERSASANVTLVLKAAAENSASSTAKWEFGGLRWYTWLFLFLLLVIALGVAYVFYRYGKSKRALG